MRATRRCVLSACAFELLLSAFLALSLEIQAPSEGLASLRVEPKKVSLRKSKGSFEKDCLSAHNKWRRTHNATSLKLDPKLSAFAKKRAESIAKSDGSEFRHPSDLEYGENLAWHSRNTSGCPKLVKMWYDELPLYSFEQPEFSHETGHFTQLVWNNTERVGCASALSEGPRGGIYLVCNYDPPGNFLGEFKENVKPAKGASTVSNTARSTTVSSTSTTTTTSTSTTTQPPSISSQSSLAGVKPQQDGNSTQTETETQRKKKKKNKKKKKKKRRKSKPQTTTPTTTATATTSTTSTTSTSKPKIQSDDRVKPKRRVSIERPTGADRRQSSMIAVAARLSADV